MKNYKIDKQGNELFLLTDLEHGEGDENLQQANIHTSDVSDDNILNGLKYVPETILAQGYKKKKNKKVTDLCIMRIENHYHEEKPRQSIIPIFNIYLD